MNSMRRYAPNLSPLVRVIRQDPLAQSACIHPQVELSKDWEAK